jgi:2C-methyl-D-erythritol 2,4-cyclodiphosphate synthase
LISSIDVPAITNALTSASALGGIELQFIAELEALEDGDSGLYLKTKAKALFDCSGYKSVAIKPTETP